MHRNARWGSSETNAPEPHEVAALLRERGEMENLIAMMVADDTTAGQALRRYLWLRQVAWAEAAGLIEGAARAHVLERYRHVVRRLLHRVGGPDVEATGPVFCTAAEMLATAVVREERREGGE